MTLGVVTEREKEDGRWVRATDILIDKSVALRAALKHRTQLQGLHRQESRQLKHCKAVMKPSDANFKHDIVKEMGTFGAATRLPLKTYRTCSGGIFDSSYEFQQGHLQACDAESVCIELQFPWPGSFKFGKAVVLIIPLHCSTKPQPQMA